MESGSSSIVQGYEWPGSMQHMLLSMFFHCGIVRKSVQRMCLINVSYLEHRESGVCWELLAGEHIIHEVTGICYGLLE